MDYEEEAENYVVDTVSSLKKQIKKLEQENEEQTKRICEQCVSWKDECTSSLSCDLNFSAFESKSKRFEAQIQILKDMIIADKMSKLCHCDICKGKMSKDREKIARELDALVIVKELQNVKSKKNDV